MASWCRALAVRKQMNTKEVGSSFTGKSAYADSCVLVCLFSQPYFPVDSEWVSSELGLDHTLTIPHGRDEGLLILPLQHENSTKLS